MPAEVGMDGRARPAERAYRFEWWIFAVTAASLVTLVAFPSLLRDRTEGMLHPHGYCYVWDPALVGAHVLGDTLIGVAYIAISIMLAVFVHRVRHLLPFHWMFLAFGLFILTCGGTHLMEVWTLWHADFWASAGLKIVTAVASVATALALPPLIPQAVRLLGAARVAEERRVQLDAAEAASRAKDLFLATLSHELRTPLNAIAGWTQLLAARGTQMDVTRAVDAIQRNVVLQTRLIEDLLDVSSIITGRLRLVRERVDFAAIVREAVDTLRKQIDEKHISLDVALPSSPLPVIGDPTRLHQVVWNLVANATKFTPDSRAITIRVEPQDAHAVLSVGDTGVGIDPVFLPRVFGAFEQGDQTTTRTNGGLGLGLAIVRQLTERHGGTVEAFSDGIDKGATFVVRLPLADRT